MRKETKKEKEERNKKQIEPSGKWNKKNMCSKNKNKRKEKSTKRTKWKKEKRRRTNEEKCKEEDKKPVEISKNIFPSKKRRRTKWDKRKSFKRKQQKPSLCHPCPLLPVLWPELLLPRDSAEANIPCVSANWGVLLSGRIHSSHTTVMELASTGWSWLLQLSHSRRKFIFMAPWRTDMQFAIHTSPQPHYREQARIETVDTISQRHTSHLSSSWAARNGSNRFAGTRWS